MTSPTVTRIKNFELIYSPDASKPVRVGDKEWEQRFISRKAVTVMRKLKIFLPLWVALSVLAGYALLAMADAEAQGIAEETRPPAPLINRGVATTPVPANGITYTTGMNWREQSPSSSLTGGVSASPTLSPCPVGVDTTSNAGYMVLITDATNGNEAVSVTGGTCTSGATSGTITFIPYFSHTSGHYSIRSASSGIQETINAACGTTGVAGTSYWRNSQCHVVIPANGTCTACYGNDAVWNNYTIYGTVYVHSNEIDIDAFGALFLCDPYNSSPTAANMTLRGPCFQVGALGVASTRFTSNSIRGASFRSPSNLTSIPAFEGVQIASTACAYNSGLGTYVETIATTTPAGFRPGDLVTVQFTDNSAYWGDALVLTASGSIFTARKQCGSSITSVSSPGVVALAYSAILDNGQGTHFENIQQDFDSEAGAFNNFFDIWNDENATITHFNNNAIRPNTNYNWSGYEIYSGGNPISSTDSQWAPVITVRDSTMTNANCANIRNSNGFYLENTVCQGQQLVEFDVSNETGNYQGATIRNVYSEGAGGANPPCSPSCPKGATTPFPGLGYAGLIAGRDSGTFKVEGNGGLASAFPTGGKGTSEYSYFVVVNDTTANTSTAPLQILNWASTGHDTIPVSWPRVGNGTDTITYDLIRTTTPTFANLLPYPYLGGCTGGSLGACGYVVQGLSQSVACGNTLTCRYTDHGATIPSAHSGTAANYPALGNYNGMLNFWPGSPVSAVSGIILDSPEQNGVGLGLGGSALELVLSCGNINSWNATSAGGWTECLNSAVNQDIANQSATILTDGPYGGGNTNVKGRLLFETMPQATIAPHDFVTLVDSAPALSMATPGNRARASIYDVAIGTDAATTPNAAQLMFRAPVSITNYIASTGSTGTGWGERLTSKLKTFSVPTQFNSSVAITGHINQNANGNWAGTCTMSASTSCTITLAGAYTRTPGCVVTVQSTTVIAGGCTVSGTTVTVTAASSNSLTWAAMLFGNPN